MTDSNLLELRSLLIKEIATRANIEIIEEKSTNQHINIMFSDFLSISISLDEIDVFYATECDSFLKRTFLSENLWLQAVGEFVVLIAQNTVTAKYFFDSKTKKCLSYEIWIEPKGKSPREIKRVTTHSNPFKALRHTKMISKVLHQGGQGDGSKEKTAKTGDGSLS